MYHLLKCCLLSCSELVIVLFNWVISRFLILVDLTLEMIKMGLSQGAFNNPYVIDYAFSSVHVILALIIPSACPLWCLWRGSVTACLALPRRWSLWQHPLVSVFSPWSFFCTAELGCALSGTKHEIYTYVHMRTLRDSALEMGHVRWHGAINSSLFLHKHLTYNSLL